MSVRLVLKDAKDSVSQVKVKDLPIGQQFLWDESCNPYIGKVFTRLAYPTDGQLPAAHYPCVVDNKLYTFSGSCRVRPIDKNCTPGLVQNLPTGTVFSQEKVDGLFMICQSEHFPFILDLQTGRLVKTGTEAETLIYNKEYGKIEQT